MKILSIGRADDCNIVLSDSMISRRHAVLKIYPTGKMEIVDMGQNGTFVNGIKLTPNVPYPVSRKDVISFAHRRQLDWSVVPDSIKLYRYILLGIALVGCIAGVVFLIGSAVNREKESGKQPEMLIQEVTIPQEPTPVTEEEPKQEEEVKKPVVKKKSSSFFFPEKRKKENKEDIKEPEKKEEPEKQPQEPIFLL